MEFLGVICELLGDFNAEAGKPWQYNFRMILGGVVIEFMIA